MFEKLKNRIIVITMVITTAVLVLAGMFVMLFSSAMRPEPKLQIELDYNTSNPAYYGEQELRDYIRSDREEGNTRLLVTLFYVGAIIEVAVFLITYFASQKIVEPVKDAYEKCRLPPRDDNTICHSSFTKKAPCLSRELSEYHLRNDYLMISPSVVPIRPAALASSVSRWTAGKNFGDTRTTTSSKISLRPLAPTATFTISLSSTPYSTAVSGVRWM